MLLAPILFLSLLEGGLRLCGYGYQTSFFRKARINGKEVFVENHEFGLRFFPLAAVRSPPATVMPARKGTNTYRVFVLGESAAMGDPEQAYGFWRYLDVLLQEQFPGTRFEVICAAMTGINSHAMLPIARECAEHDGDLWVIYMGNNEMIGPFGPSNSERSRVPGLPSIRFSLALKTTRLGQLLDRIGSGFARESKSSKTWRGMAMFLEHQVRHDAPARQRAREHFKANLDDILDLAERNHIKVVVSTVASNLRNCAPFASLHSPALQPGDLRRWKQLYDEGAAAESAGKHAEARDKYVAAAQIDDDYAELQFRLGNCYLALTNQVQALRCFERARDFDALAFRTDSQLNEIIAQAANRRSAAHVRLADPVKLIRGRTPAQVPGHEFFYEHVHLNFDGNYLLAVAVADQLAELLPANIKRRDRQSWLAPHECALRLALTDWNRYHSAEAMLQRILVAPFTGQLNHDAQVERLQQELARSKANLTPEAALQARAIFANVFAARPNDYLARRKYAEFLAAVADTAGAMEQWRAITGLLPHHPIAYFRLGQLLAQSGKPVEAEGHLQKALRIRPDFADARVELGKALVQQGKLELAVAAYQDALRIEPDSAAAYYHLANAFLAQNKRSDAARALHEAVRLRPAFWEAHYLLGLELARAGDDAGALIQFADVVRLEPSHAVAHLNLGVALQKRGRTVEARKHFREVLRLNPSNEMAQTFLNQLPPE